METLVSLLTGAGIVAGLGTLLLAVPKAFVGLLVVRLWTAQMRRNGVSDAKIAACTLAYAMRGLSGTATKGQ